MKRIIVITIMLIAAIGLNSCNKTEVNEWTRFYGYTKNDIVGHYTPNPDESAYPELPTNGVQVYRNATIDITDLGPEQNLVQLHIVIPDVINKTFSGVLYSNENESDLAFHNFNNEDILMTVYKNKQNQVRLHGRERRCGSDISGDLIDCALHGFDVVKTSNSSNSK